MSALPARAVCVPLLGIALAAPAGGPPQSAAPTPQPAARAPELKADEKTDTAAMAAYVKGMNDFAADLYRQLGRQDGNLFLSPFSVHVALSMARTGARGKTAAAMAKALRVEGAPDQLTASARQVLTALKPGVEDGTKVYELAVANALWSSPGYPLRDEFTRALRQGFQVEAREVDFAKNRSAACRTINAWVNDATRGKISEIVDAMQLPDLTRLVLTNAIYFKSPWAEPFSKQATKDAPFHVRAGEKLDVPFLNQVKEFPYWKTDAFQGVELPYAGHELSMVLVIPNEIDGLAAVEKSFSARTLDEGLKSARRTKLFLSMPRFRTEAAFSLGDALVAMGMGDAFSPAADFSGMTEKEALYVDSVIHKSFIVVDEAGTEAAAATAVAVAARAAPPKDPIPVRADRPFLYAIRHARTGAVLFLGRLVQPGAR